MSQEPITFRKLYRNSDYSETFRRVVDILEEHRLEIRALKLEIKHLKGEKN